MKTLYSLGIFLYSSLIYFASFFNSKAKRFIAGRKKIFQSIENQDFKNSKNIWIHAASLGEFEQGRPVIEALREQYPSHKILLTFFSPSGYEASRNYPFVDYIRYLPIDTASNMKKFIKLTNPQLVILIKYEFWPHLINQLSLAEIPTIVISAIFRKEQIFFKIYGKFMLNSLRKIQYFFVQDETSLQLLKNHHINHAKITGDTRFDRVYKISQQNRELDFIPQFVDNQFTIIAGSTWKEDENYFVKYINQNKLPIKYIFAPHEIDLEKIKEFQQKLKISSILYSEITTQNLHDYQLLIIDSIGLLTTVYRYGTVAYVGGGFGKDGIHNILEPACYGKAVFHGPNYTKFNEAKEMLLQKGSVVTPDYTMFQNTINQLYNDEKYRNELEVNSLRYIQNNIGATKIIMQYLQKNILK